MAQRSSKRQPVYSADALALRYLAGLVLVALGVMMFLAVEMRMTGNIFAVLRQVCFGLAGGLAPVLPALPVWAGVLVIWSSQRKAPARPFAFAAMAFLGVCAFVVLVTRIGSEEYLALLARNSDGSWGGVIHRGYVQSVQMKASGGVLGVILAYPFWTLLGTVLGAVIVFLLTAFCALLVFGLTPGRIRDLAAGKTVLRWGRKPKDQEEMDQRQIAFQQEQERRRQEEAQRQAYILQQEAAARDAQQSARWQRQNPQDGYPMPGYPQQVPGGTAPQPVSNWPGTGMGAAMNTGVADLLDQAGNQSVPADGSRRSRIFEGGQEKETPRRQSRIFGGRKNRDDGLSDLSAEEKKQEGMSWPGTGRRRMAGQTGRTVSGAEIGPVSTRWNAADQDPAVQRIYSEAAENSRRKPNREEDSAGSGQTDAQTSAFRNGELRTDPERNGSAGRGGRETPFSRGADARRDPEEDDLARWREPEEERRTREPAAGEAPGRQYDGRRTRGGGTAGNDGFGGARRTPGPEQETTAAGNASAGGKNGNRRPEEEPRSAALKAGTGPSTWDEQAAAAQEAAGGNGETVSGGKPPAVKVPAGRRTIKNPTWEPELKGVEPGEPEPEEEFWEPTPYYAPPITDLKKPEISVLDTSAEDGERSVRLEETLANFRVQARVKHVTHGPAISRFEIELAPGTKVGKVSELEKDIAYGMQATSVRIEAPIPGKSLVGVEVPNPARATVTLREVLESPVMQNAKSILTVALGKDIAGVPVICDLAKMPHMLIAGATGSGKSVCINTIINSLLFRAGPDEVKLILVDPKVVELQCYNGIPHLLLPVVNDPHKAAAALAWAVAEMMERYDRFSEKNVRNLDGYNGALKPGEKPMPRIVIIIDELADLMMVCKKDVEEYICRLTQLARAAGIHLIVATQRPSVDVITGLIKANIPSRIAFKTASSVDSRTILDRNGSERLLGLGDMLYLPTGSFAPTRVQGCFLSDEEVNRIADHVRRANPSSYDPDILDKLEQLSKGAEDAPSMDLIGGVPETGGSGDAELFGQAVEIAIQDGQVSTSTLQRRLKVGYARAGRLTDEMEARGIVSAKDGSKPRKCLITREEWLAMQEEDRT